MALSPDILVLSEVRRDAIKDELHDGRAAWAGPDEHKGLGLICSNGWSVENFRELDCQYFTPCTVRRGDDSVFVLGVWTHAAPYYVSSLRRALNEIRSEISGGGAIIAGDFNQSVIFDTKCRDELKFSRVLRDLSGIGLNSAWHTYADEAHGAESQSTYYHRRKRAEPFHIDFVFASDNLMQCLSDVRVGSFDDWVSTGLSDHTPVSATFNTSRF